MNTVPQPGIFRAILNRDRRTWRTFVLFAIIAALLGVATAAALPAHFHARTTAGCDVCLTASLAATAQVATVHFLVAPEPQRLVVFSPGKSLYTLLRFDASRTRGPPATAL